jgi:hypothetical protein
MKYRIRFTAAALLSIPLLAQAADAPLKPLFAEGPVKEGWTVRHWADIAQQPKKPITWEVRDGVLQGQKLKDDWVGTWLMSEREYGDFVLELDFKFKEGGNRGNGGIALRAPLKGDPAYAGFEMQITDPRYERSFFPDAKPEQLTGALYLVHPPKKQMYRADDWNHYRIEMRGSTVKAWLNGEQIQDIDVATLTAPAKMHGKGQELLDAPSGAERPRRGHIGFQDLSDDGEVLLFRNLKIAELG